MRKNQYPLFVHPYETFSKSNIKDISKLYDFPEKRVVEFHMWVYELYAHIQKIGGKECVLKGGAATQLHLPLCLQRCTIDLDCATDLSPKELVKLLNTVKHSLQGNRFYVDFREYIPKKVIEEGRTLPMMTFIFDLPLYFSSADSKQFSGLKMDFLLVDTKKMHKVSIIKGETLGLSLNYNPSVIDKYSTISDKLITIATSTMGLERRNLVGIYKNIYDLYCLITTSYNFESFKIISQRLKDSLSFEIEMKKTKAVSINELLEDILSTLYRISVIDINFEFKVLPYSVSTFVAKYLQATVREQLDLDMWSIMALFLYIWTFALKEYIEQGVYSKLELMNSIVDEYAYYLELNAKNKYKFRAELRKRIKEKNNAIFLQDIKHPLRLIYLDRILRLDI